MVTSSDSSDVALPRHATAAGPAELWRSAERLVVNADVEGIRANKLGPLAARSMRARGRHVTRELANDARLAKAAWMTSIPLISRIRSLCDGPLLLIKGAEVAALYPGRARSFSDVDLLAPDAHAVHQSLLRNGFVEVDDPEIYERDQHHLRPVQCPGFWPWVEVHVRPAWPAGLPPPPIHEIVAAAGPSATGVPGICAPHPAHHAMILASHAWVDQPLQYLRVLVDVAAVAAQTDERELERVAREWGIEGIWRTTYQAATGLLGGDHKTLAVRLWGRHLPVVKERSVLGNHAQRWLHPFWELPFTSALRATALAFRQTALPYPDETWREKRIRVRQAIVHPGAPVSSHTEAWRRAAGAEGPDDPGAGERPAAGTHLH